MTYEIVLSSLQSAYNWLFSVFFPRIFAFLKNNEFVSAALIISLVLPALFVIFNFFVDASSDAELYTSKIIKNKRDKAQKDEQKELRKQINYSRNNIYQQAYYNSLKYDKK